MLHVLEGRDVIRYDLEASLDERHGRLRLLDGVLWDRIGDRGPRFEVAELEGETTRNVLLRAGAEARPLAPRWQPSSGSCRSTSREAARTNWRRSTTRCAPPFRAP